MKKIFSIVAVISAFISSMLSKRVGDVDKCQTSHSALLLGSWRWDGEVDSKTILFCDDGTCRYSYSSGGDWVDLCGVFYVDDMIVALKPLSAKYSDGNYLYFDRAEECEVRYLCILSETKMVFLGIISGDVDIHRARDIYGIVEKSDVDDSSIFVKGKIK